MGGKSRRDKSDLKENASCKSEAEKRLEKRGSVGRPQTGTKLKMKDSTMKKGKEFYL